MSKATKWRKVGDEWRRGPLRVIAVLGGWSPCVATHEGYLSRIQAWDCPSHKNTPRPEAAMRAADKWAARMLKALRKLEGK